MLYEVMRHIRNFFPTGKKINGKFNIKDGSINLPLLDNQYFLIEGSVLNDGVYKYPTDSLVDETFDGVITPLAVPKSFVDLCEEIKAYNDNNPVGAYTSESFGGYSYTKATDSNGNVASWKNAFSTRLEGYRKL